MDNIKGDHDVYVVRKIAVKLELLNDINWARKWVCDLEAHSVDRCVAFMWNEVGECGSLRPNEPTKARQKTTRLLYGTEAPHASPHSHATC